MNDTVVFSIGRFNPPTKGHFFLFDRMKKEAKEREADLVVFVTDSHDIKRNPLYISDKLYYLKNMFKGLEFQRIANAHYAMLWLADNGYKTST